MALVVVVRQLEVQEAIAWSPGEMDLFFLFIALFEAKSAYEA